MNTPPLLPMLKPFEQAVAYQLARVPMTRKAFDTLSNEAKLRAFTIGGLARRALLEEAHRQATTALADNLTKPEFLERLGDVLDQQEGLYVSPRRLDLIAQNNIAVAYSAGRYAQMNDPDILGERPYRQYPLGPSDGRTTVICRDLQGLVARHDDPIWLHISPPNHDGERHIKVLTLTAEQAKESGKIYESAGELEYPVLDGRTILPDPGWDFAPGLLTADDRALVEAANAIGGELPAKTAVDYGLELIADVKVKGLPKAPRVLAEAITDVSYDAQYAEAWNAFREAVGIAEGADQTIVVDGQRDGVRITRATFEHMLGLDAGEAARNQKKDRPRWFGRIVPSLEDPFETWMQTRVGRAEVAFTKRHIALYDSGKKNASASVMYADLSPDGWLMETGFVSAKQIEKLRTGRLLHSKARRDKRMSSHARPAAVTPSQALAAARGRCRGEFISEDSAPNRRNASVGPPEASVG